MERCGGLSGDVKEGVKVLADFVEGKTVHVSVPFNRYVRSFGAGGVKLIFHEVEVARHDKVVVNREREKLITEKSFCLTGAGYRITGLQTNVQDREYVAGGDACEKKEQGMSCQGWVKEGYGNLETIDEVFVDQCCQSCGVCAEVGRIVIAGVVREEAFVREQVEGGEVAVVFGSQLGFLEKGDLV